MKISGIQKFTLLDYPGKTAATLFFGGCDFRCPYCHNASLVLSKDMPGSMEEKEVFEFLKKREGVLDGVCISGGEPLLQEGLEGFAAKIKEHGFSVKLDTNGQFHEKLKMLLENNLVDYVAMDIKNALHKYGETIGIKNFDTTQVEKSADLLMKGSIPYEFRTTVVQELHETQDFHLLGKRFKGAKKYFLQPFVDSGDLLAQGFTACSEEDMIRFCEILSAYIPSATLRS